MMHEHEEIDDVAEHQEEFYEEDKGLTREEELQLAREREERRRNWLMRRAKDPARILLLIALLVLVIGGSLLYLAFTPKYENNIVVLISGIAGLSGGIGFLLAASGAARGDTVGLTFSMIIAYLALAVVFGWSLYSRYNDVSGPGKVAVIMLAIIVAGLTYVRHNMSALRAKRLEQKVFPPHSGSGKSIFGVILIIVGATLLIVCVPVSKQILSTQLNQNAYFVETMTTEEAYFRKRLKMWLDRNKESGFDNVAIALERLDTGIREINCQNNPELQRRVEKYRVAIDLWREAVNLLKEESPESLLEGNRYLREGDAKAEEALADIELPRGSELANGKAAVQ